MSDACCSYSGFKKQDLMTYLGIVDVVLVHLLALTCLTKYPTRCSMAYLQQSVPPDKYYKIPSSQLSRQVS